MRGDSNRIHFLALTAIFIAAFSVGARAEEEKSPEPNSITLQGLNKVTGRTSKFSGSLGTVLHFGNLEMVARRCWRAPPEERPENAALLEISERKQAEAPTRVFLGWMFSSSPSLSGPQHPVYDIAVISCDYSSKAATDEAEESAAKEPDQR